MNIVKPTLTWLAALTALFLVTGFGLGLLSPLQHSVPAFGLMEDVAVLLLWLYVARQAVHRAPKTSQPTLWKSLAAVIGGIATLLAWGSFARALEGTTMSALLALLLVVCAIVGWFHCKLMLEQVREFAQQWRRASHSD